jgi:O-antigen/teichoic acid export membrane protein
VLALALTPPLGLEGVALATAIPYVLLFPYLLRVVLRAIPVPLGELARQAFVPAWSLGLALAAILAGARLALDPATPAAVLGTAAAGLAGYWVAYYLLWLDRPERGLVRGLLRL